MKDYSGEYFLNHLYQDLHMSDEVMHTANPSDSKDEKVRKYLERLKEVEELAKNSKYNGIELLKEMYYKKYVIKPEDVPESYFEMQKRIALERGFGHVDISDKEKQQLIDNVISDQKHSLDIWLDYLMSSDAMYPEWFKYYAFQGMLRLGSYDKETATFHKRTSSTTNSFVDLNREALALVYDNLCNILSGNTVDDSVLQQLLENGSFSKLYAYMIKKIDSSRKDIIDGNDGIWVKYNQGSKPDELVKSLEGKGTGWCTAGMETARAQLQGGDFYVYYTKDSNGECKQPRIAIRMQGNSIGEIRGINSHQNLESEMEEVLNKKLEEFPDKDKYKKKVNDMERLTTIYKKYKKEDLTKEELRFLYEVDEEIKGFGYWKDPRIAEIRKDRNLKKDLALVFDCHEDEISNNKQDVLDGKKILYFYGDLDLSYLTSAEGLTLPSSISGGLYLGSLTRAEGLILPSSIGGHLRLGSLTRAEGLTLPSSISGALNLGRLISAEGLILPSSIGSDLFLDSLTSVEGLTLPGSIGGSLYLKRLTSAEGLTLPNSIGGSLNLSSITSAEGLTLPSSIGGYLNLRRLTSAKGLTLPNSIGESLDLSSLKSVEGLIVPKNFTCSGLISFYFTMEDLIKKSLENDEVKNKQRGFSKISILIALSLLASIEIIILGVWLVS